VVDGTPDGEGGCDLEAAKEYARDMPCDSYEVLMAAQVEGIP
jgi:hypothetical protein